MMKVRLYENRYCNAVAGVYRRTRSLSTIRRRRETDSLGATLNARAARTRLPQDSRSESESARAEAKTYRLIGQLAKRRTNQRTAPITARANHRITTRLIVRSDLSIALRCSNSFVCGILSRYPHSHWAADDKLKLPHEGHFITEKRLCAGIR